MSRTNTINTNTSNKDNNNNNNHPSSMASTTTTAVTTLQETLSDLASWWCHRILSPSSTTSSTSSNNNNDDNDDDRYYYYLNDLRKSAHQLKDIENLIEILHPVNSNSPIINRFRCLVIWKEFIQQMIVLDDNDVEEEEDDGNNNNNNNSEDDDHSENDDSRTDKNNNNNNNNDDNNNITDVGRRNFTTLLNQLKAAHDIFSAQQTTTTAAVGRRRQQRQRPPPPSNYDEVIRLVNVHDKLSCLYRALAPESTWEMSCQEFYSTLADCRDSWDSIFYNIDDDQTEDDDDAVAVVPIVLANIVDTDQPDLTPQTVQRRINDVLLGRRYSPTDVGTTTTITTPTRHNNNIDDDTFSCAHLQRSLQKLLLYWCEVGVEGGHLPELVRLGYRGIKVINTTTVEIMATENPPALAAAAGGGGGGVVDVGVTDEVNNNTAPATDAGGKSAISKDDNNNNNINNNNGGEDSRNYVSGNPSHVIHQPNIFRKRKRRLLTSVPVNDDNHEKENREEEALDRGRRSEELELTVDDDTSSSSTSDVSHYNIHEVRKPWPSEFDSSESDGEIEGWPPEFDSESDGEREKENRGKVQIIQIPRRQRRRRWSHPRAMPAPKPGSQQLLATKDSRRPGVSNRNKMSSSTPSTMSSGNRHKLLSPPMMTTTARASTTTRRNRPGPLPVNQGDFMTPPEDSAITGDRSSGNPVTGSVARKRKRILWEHDEDRALLEGVDILGFGNWAAIKAEYPLRLRRRTNADLKDRARTLRRQGVIVLQLTRRSILG